MRLALVATLLAAVALAGAAAALPASAADARLDALAPLDSLAPAPAWPAAEASDVPGLTGAQDIVGRAAALAYAPGGLPPGQLGLLALDQQLRASLDPTTATPWGLERWVPAYLLAPAASTLTPAPAVLALPHTAQSAVVAASAVGALALLLPKVPVLPLYSRIEREETMLNARRAQLYELVRAEPGIHLSDLVRRSGLGWGAALYHLSVLEKNRVVVAHPEGGFKRYFANGLHPRQDMARLTALRHGAARSLFDAVVATPGRSGRELASHLGLSPSTLARASERLEDAGLVRRVRAGRRVLYFPAEPQAEAAAGPPPGAVAAA